MKRYLYTFTFLLILCPFALAQECKIRIRTIGYDSSDPSKIFPDQMSSNQVKWWNEEGKKKFPNVCFVASDEETDYIIAMTDRFNTWTYSVPRTTTHTGQATTIGDNTTYSGTSISSGGEQYQGRHWVVTVFAFKAPRGKRQIPAVFSATHTGKLRWSKPDKDAFEKALKAVTKEAEK